MAKLIGKKHEQKESEKILLDVPVSVEANSKLYCGHCNRALQQYELTEELSGKLYEMCVCHGNRDVKLYSRKGKEAKAVNVRPVGVVIHVESAGN